MKFSTSILSLDMRNVVAIAKKKIIVNCFVISRRQIVYSIDIYCCARRLILVSFYTYSNSIYVFEVLYRIPNIVVDSFINIEADFVFIVFQRKIYVCQTIYLEAFVVAL